MSRWGDVPGNGRDTKKVGRPTRLVSDLSEEPLEGKLPQRSRRLLSEGVQVVTEV